MSERDEQLTKYIDEMKEKRDNFSRIRELGVAINLESESLGVKQMRGLMVKCAAAMVDYIDHMLQGMQMSREGVAEVAATVVKTVEPEVKKADGPEVAGFQPPADLANRTRDTVRDEASGAGI